MPTPKHKPTDETRASVTRYAMAGVPHHDISMLIGISTITLLKYYRRELDMGKSKAISLVAGKLFENAVKNNNLGAQIFYLKTQGGPTWSERQHMVIEEQMPLVPRQGPAPEGE